jgi:hypothetical protein
MEMAQQGTVMDIVPHSFTKPYSNTQCRHLFKQLIDAIDHRKKYLYTQCIKTKLAV